MYRMLLLSDLHFGSSHFFRQERGDPESLSLVETLVESFAQDNDDDRMDCVVVAGDVFSDEQSIDLGTARGELRSLFEAFRPRSFAIVPGNHDLTWEEQFDEDRQYYYKRLISELDDLPIGAAVDGQPEIVELTAQAERPLAILLLDSCRLEGRVTAGLGRVGDQQLGSAGRLLAERGITDQSHRILAVLHHHLLPVTVTSLPQTADPREGPFPRVSLTVDAVEVLRRLSNFGVSVALHGHQHYRAVLHFRNDTWQEPGSIRVVAAGSCGASDTRRQFFVLEVDDLGATVTSYAEHPDYEPLFGPDVELGPVRITFDDLR